jgi:hypothetical protein
MIVPRAAHPDWVSSGGILPDCVLRDNCHRCGCPFRSQRRDGPTRSRIAAPTTNAAASHRAPDISGGGRWRFVGAIAEELTFGVIVEKGRKPIQKYLPRILIGVYLCS